MGSARGWAAMSVQGFMRCAPQEQQPYKGSFHACGFGVSCTEQTNLSVLTCCSRSRACP